MKHECFDSVAQPMPSWRCEMGTGGRIWPLKRGNHRPAGRTRAQGLSPLTGRRDACLVDRRALQRCQALPPRALPPACPSRGRRRTSSQSRAAPLPKEPGQLDEPCRPCARWSWSVLPLGWLPRGNDALAVVDVHEPSEQRSSVRPVGPSLRAVAPRESLMVTHRIMVHRPSSARSCAFSATSAFMASRAFAFRSFSRAMCSSGDSSRPNPGLAPGTSRGFSNVGTVTPTE
jgi:hypothetical protein